MSIQSIQLRTAIYLKKHFPNFKINVVKKLPDGNKTGKVIEQGAKESLNELMRLLRWYNANGWEIYLDLNQKNLSVLDDLKGNKEEILNRFNFAQMIIETSPCNFHAVLVFNKDLTYEEEKAICDNFGADPAHAHSVVTRFPGFISKKHDFLVKLYKKDVKKVLNKEDFLKKAKIEVKREKESTRVVKVIPFRKIAKQVAVPDVKLWDNLYFEIGDASRVDYVFCFRCFDAGLTPEATAELLKEIALLKGRKKSRTYFRHTAQKAFKAYKPQELFY